jgi:class 3 adenylate cyclase/tetratricopeptide (TPR) repeat protein
MITCPVCTTVNADAARFCSNCGSPLETPRALAGERKLATILFADVAGSTSLAEQMDAEDWAEAMNGAFAFMNASVSRYDGTVSRLMGDAVLALFGAPVAHEDDAERAIRAGLDMQAAARDYAAAMEARHGIQFELRVGINTGIAVLAFVGDTVRSEYTAMGDAANIAARLQSAAEPGTVLISAETQRLARGAFDFKPRGTLELKGKAQAVATFEVIGLSAAATSGRGLEGLNSPMVGRDDEIGLLRRRLAGLAEHGATVAVVGEAGLGKSRLIAELRQANEEPGGAARWLEGRAISYGQSMPYYPWRQIGRQMIGASEADGAPTLRDKLKAFLARLGLAAGQAPLLETMMGIETDESRAALSLLSGEEVVSGIAGAVAEAIKSGLHEGGKTYPQIIVMDDLHWSDSASLELIAQVAPLTAFEPLLFVCVLRPDRRAGSWGLADRLAASLGSSFDRIDLEPLDPSASRELLGNLLHVEDLPESIRGQILARSEGNPFYLEEVLRTLIDGGQVLRDGEHWRATRDIIDAKIPETLAGVLSARIDRLTESTKRVAQTAAVIGRVFQHRVLDRVCKDAPVPERIEHVEPHIATLTYEQLVREKAREPDREYIFKHALTCDAAYDLLLKARRRELHGRVGMALEALYPERLSELAALLAHHFAEAEDAARALSYSRQAAETARRVYALGEELVHREGVLAALEQMPGAAPTERIDAILDWTIVRHRLNRYDGVIAQMERAIALARELGDKRRLGLSLSWIANLHFVMGFPSRSVPYLLESQELGRELGDVRMVMLPMFFATWAVVDRDPAAAVERLAEVIELARQNNVADVIGHAMAHRAVALARIGAYEKAQAQIDEALAMLPHTPSPVKRADIHIGVGMAYHDMGQLDAGLRHSRLGAELAEQEHGLECACAGYYGAGRVQLERKQLADAHADIIRSLKYADMSGFETFLNGIKGGVALTEFEQGSATAIEGLKTAVENARGIHDDYAAASMSEQLGDALLRLDRREESEHYLDEALAYFRKAGMSPYVASTLRILSRLYEQAGRKDDATKAREESAKILMEIAGAAFPTRQRETV